MNSFYVTANNFDSFLEMGHNRRISNPYHQGIKITAMAASSIIIDNTPAITAFLIFPGVFSLYALKSGV
jgi:hypothetical protein